MLKRQFQYFGHFPAKYRELGGDVIIQTMAYLMHDIPPAKMTHFYRTTEKEVCRKDKKFIGKIMMLDWRDRPTADQLLQDDWFKEEKLEEE